MADVFQEFSTIEIETLWKLLKKLYSFDGNRQDGFEEIGMELTSDNDLEQKILEDIASKRKSQK